MKINSRAVDPDKVMTKDEVRQVIAAAPARVALMVEFLYTTGARISEALDLLAKDCHRQRRAVSVRIVGKGVKERRVNISVGLFLRISDEFRGRKYLFETTGGARYTRQYVGREVRAAGDSALGRKVTPHCFRHSFATNTIERTGKIKGVSKYLGHASTTTTMDMYNQEKLEFMEVDGF